MNNKSKSYKAGYSWAKRTLKENYMEQGKAAIYKADKASRTCYKYAKDKRITQTKNGKKLTPSMRDYYEGISDGFFDGYNEL